MRLVTGSGGGYGGTADFTTHTHLTDSQGSHQHSLVIYDDETADGGVYKKYTSTTASAGAHTHTALAATIKYVNTIVCRKD